jgi:hypothetical protein
VAASRRASSSLIALGEQGIPHNSIDAILLTHLQRVFHALTCPSGLAASTARQIKAAPVT